jgi:hypothetical protein
LHILSMIWAPHWKATSPPLSAPLRHLSCTITMVAAPPLLGAIVEPGSRKRTGAEPNWDAAEATEAASLDSRERLSAARAPDSLRSPGRHARPCRMLPGTATPLLHGNEDLWGGTVPSFTPFGICATLPPTPIGSLRTDRQAPADRSDKWPSLLASGPPRHAESRGKRWQIPRPGPSPSGWWSDEHCANVAIDMARPVVRHGQAPLGNARGVYPQPGSRRVGACGDSARPRRTDFGTHIACRTTISLEIWSCPDTISVVFSADSRRFPAAR